MFVRKSSPEIPPVNPSARRRKAVFLQPAHLSQAGHSVPAAPR